MAKIKFGMMMTDARGKLGGQVFSKNRSGAFVRTKVTPANPRSVAQMQSRSFLSTLSIGWNSLSNAQRASWNGAVEAWQKTNIFGDLVKPSGKNLYTALNKNLLQCSKSIINTAPGKMTLPAINVSSVAVSISGSTITTGLATVPADVTLQISATPALNNGVNYVRGKFRVIMYAPSGALTPAQVFSAYVAKFGAPIAGQNIHFQFKYIGSNGQASTPISVKAVIS